MIGTVALVLALAGCNGCAGTAEERADDDPNAAAAGSEATSSGPPVAEPGPAPTVRVRGEIDAHARTVTPRIESSGPEATRIGALAIERRRGDSWAPVEEVSLGLRYACDAEPEACVTLAPGAVFIPPAWLGVRGDAQCECDDCPREAAGVYRFVVRGCDPSEPAEGEPFELP